MNVPKSWALAKGYHLGGPHVGGAVYGALWSLGPTVVATGEVAVGLLLLCYVHALLLPGIVMTARPGLRAKRRDLFERVHRFGGFPEVTPPLRSGAAAQAGEQGGPACPDVLALTRSALSPSLARINSRTR